MLEEKTTTQLHHLAPTHEILPKMGLLWWQWTLLFLSLALLFWFIRDKVKNRKKNQQQAEASLLEKTIKQINQLSEEQQKTEEKTKRRTTIFSQELSLHIRQYLNTLDGDPALYETNQETQKRAFDGLHLQANMKASLLDFLNRLDQLNYQQTSNQEQELGIDQKKLKQSAIQLLKETETAYNKHNKTEQITT